MPIVVHKHAFLVVIFSRGMSAFSLGTSITLQLWLSYLLLLTLLLIWWPLPFIWSKCVRAHHKYYHHSRFYSFFCHCQAYHLFLDHSLFLPPFQQHSRSARTSIMLVWILDDDKCHKAQRIEVCKLGTGWTTFHMK